MSDINEKAGLAKVLVRVHPAGLDAFTNMAQTLGVSRNTLFRHAMAFVLKQDQQFVEFVLRRKGSE